MLNNILNQELTTKGGREMLKTDNKSVLKVKNLVRRHYGIQGVQVITDDEVLQEINSLNRHYNDGSLDNFYEALYYDMARFIEV